MKSSRKFHQGTQSTKCCIPKSQRNHTVGDVFFFSHGSGEEASQLAQSLLFEITQVLAKVVENLCDFIQRRYGCQGHEG